MLPEALETERLAGPTLRDIAEQLGVSTATVSLAMRSSRRISQNTQKRVKAALAESGYVYRRGAASLRTSKTHTVGVILNNVSDPFFSALLAALEAALAKTGRTAFLCNTDESPEREAEFLKKMSEYNADGLIVSPAIGSTAERFSGSSPAHPPVVFISRTFFDSSFDYVVNDDREAARLATEHLLRRGHTRIALAGGMPGVSGFDERLAGYRETLEGMAVPFDESLVLPCVPTRREGFNAARRIAKLSARPTAAACYNDSVALGLFYGLIEEGLYPGRNFALVGNEDIEEVCLVRPQITVTRVPRDEMGRQAAAALVRRIENPDAPPQRIVLKTELVIRDTCCTYSPAT